MKLAPIILFAYNRPKLLRQTLESLQANHLAPESDLFIFCDGPKANAKESDLQKITDVRNVAHEQHWCKSVTVFESEINMGLGPSIINGVTKIINDFGKVIVIEDDLISSPYFLEFMNLALEKYEKENKVMHISGYMFPVKKELPELFFYCPPTCWGWATWKRAWDTLETNPKILKQRLIEKELYKYFNLDGHSDFALQLDLNIKRIINTWYIKWYATIVLNNGISLHPAKSFINNIGFGVDASNTKRGFDSINNNYLSNKINFAEIPIEESQIVRKSMKEFYDSLRKNIIIKSLFKYYTSCAIIRYLFYIYNKYFY